MRDGETVMKCQSSSNDYLQLYTSCTFEMNTTCGYWCVNGYIKSDPPFVVCSSNGTWNEDLNQLCKDDDKIKIMLPISFMGVIMAVLCLITISSVRMHKSYKREHPESQLVEISPSDRVSRNAYASVSKSRNVCPSVSGSVLSTSQLNTYTTPTDSSENVYWEIGEVYSQPKNIEKPQLYHKHYNGIGEYIQKGSSVRSERYSKFPVKNADEGGYLEACHVGDCNDFLPVPDYEHDDWLEPSPQNGSLNAVRKTNYENMKT